MYIKLCHRKSQTVSILASGILEPLVEQNSWIGFVKHICYSFTKVNELIIILYRFLYRIGNTFMYFWSSRN